MIGAANAGLKRLDAAIEAYKNAIKIKPNVADAYSNIGVALKKKGRFSEAIDFYQKAIKKL